MTTAPSYRHTQIGTLILTIFGIGALILVYWGVRGNWQAPQALVLVILVVCMRLFATLTVEIRDEELRILFGPGFPRKTLRLADIRRARAVRSRWFYGWGIRRIPQGWLFNVSGQDAVEVVMASGATYWIGTDEPDALLAAISARAPSGVIA